MKVSVRLFAVLRERAGSDGFELELPEGATVADALAALRGQPGLDEPLAKLDVGTAVNREYTGRDAELAAGDELALVPPVSGGGGRTAAERVHARVTGEPLSAAEVTDLVGSPGAGAVITFQGTTRDVERLDYEAYAEMAQQKMVEILTSCIERHELEAAAAEHRTGSVPLGEPSVIVAVSAAHRAEAFGGAREAIDRIKAEAPIWKSEVEAGESRRVEGTPPPGAESQGAGTARA